MHYRPPIYAIAHNKSIVYVTPQPTPILKSPKKFGFVKIYGILHEY